MAREGLSMWTEQDVLDILYAEWERSQTELEAATVKGVAEQLGVWPVLADALSENGWEVDSYEA
jgi:hypothetical protein